MPIAVAESITAEIQLLAEPRSARTARRFVAHQLASDSFHAPHLTDVVKLLVSELVTNVAVHTDSDLMTLTLTRRGDTLRVAVHDSSSTLPKRIVATSGRESGRGLFLVSAIADRWGSDVEPDGKTVWAEAAC